MKIRPATLEDVRAIVKVHTAEERLNGSIHERYTMGGPWMTVETLAIHLNNLLLSDQLVAVAELNGKVVGEVEVIFSKEPVNGKPMRIAHIDVIEVHPDYRGRGIGRALIEFVEEVAGERGVEMLTVQPDEEAKGFYKRLGFDVELFRGRTVWIPAGGVGGNGNTEVLEFGWDDVGNLELVAGHFQSSYSMYFSAFRDNIAGIHYTIESGRARESYYALRNLPGREGVALLLWGSIEDVEPVLGRVKALGFRRALTAVPEDMGGFGVEVVGKLEILGKPLI